MKENFYNFINKYMELYNVLEEFVNKKLIYGTNHEYKIIISCDYIDKMHVLNMALKINKDEEDGFELKFDDKDKASYKYLVVNLIYKIYEKVIVHYDKDKHLVYNNRHKPYLSFVINDNSIIYDVEKTIEYMQKDKMNDMLDYYFNSLYFEINKKNRKIDGNIIEFMETKKKLTKKMIKDGEYE